MTIEDRIQNIELALIKAGLMEPPPYTLDDMKAALAGDRAAIRRVVAAEIRKNKSSLTPVHSHRKNREAAKGIQQ